MVPEPSHADTPSVPMGIEPTTFLLATQQEEFCTSLSYFPESQSTGSSLCNRSTRSEPGIDREKKMGHT